MISCKFQCILWSDVESCCVHIQWTCTHYRLQVLAGKRANCYISKHTWPLTIQTLNCWSRSHDVFIYMGTDLKIQSLRTMNNPANQRRSLKLQAKLYYTKYPLLISIVYANSLPDAPNRFVIKKKENRGYLFEIKGDL